jgi:hypothetical protein
MALTRRTGALTLPPPGAGLTSSRHPNNGKREPNGLAITTRIPCGNPA